MHPLVSTKSGFTLVEVLVSVGIMLIFLPFAASMLTNSQLLASCSKHKIQAAFAARQIIETERQLGYTSGSSYNNFGLIQASQGTYPITLDLKGDYNNTNPSSHFMGTASVTVTAETYTNSSGAILVNSNVDHIVVKITWSEQFLNLQIPMTAYYAEDIAFDPMLN